MNQASKNRAPFDPRALKPGSLVPGTKWSVVGKLGEGGMGVVLEVTKPPGIRGAMKLLVPEMAGRREHVERFFEEVRLLAMLEHQNIVRVFDCDLLVDGSPYLVMERLDGVSLRSALIARGQEKGFPPDAVHDIAHAMGAALDCAHGEGIVHRDVKPDNVFLHAPGTNEKERIVLLDFGIAALTDEARALERVGTPLYMAPERFRGEPATAASDIYSMAVVVYEMLTGQLPWPIRGQGARAAMEAHLHSAPPPPSRFVPSLPRGIDAHLLAALHKDPSRRPRFASAFVQDLYELQWCGGRASLTDANTTAPSISTVVALSRGLAGSHAGIASAEASGRVVSLEVDASALDAERETAPRDRVDRLAPTPTLASESQPRRARVDTEEWAVRDEAEASTRGKPIDPNTERVELRVHPALSALQRWAPWLTVVATVVAGVLILSALGLWPTRRIAAGPGTSRERTAARSPNGDITSIPFAMPSAAQGEPKRAAPSPPGPPPADPLRSQETEHAPAAQPTVRPNSLPPSSPGSTKVVPAGSGSASRLASVPSPWSRPSSGGGTPPSSSGAKGGASARPAASTTIPDDGRDLLEEPP